MSDETSGLDEAAEQAAPDEGVQDTQDIALSLWDQVLDFGVGLMRPWNAYQVGIAIGLILVAFALSRIFGPMVLAWMRTREGWPKWRYRYLLLLQKRLALIFFVILIWATVLVMREVTWPSRSYILGIIANLSLAWLVIALVARLVQNNLVRAVIRYGAWIWVTLVVLGVSDETRQLLDAAALNVGSIRL